ncbi:cupin domain-containing protein [Alsobacter sp. SYSU M60028]|uniref:Cupin domain-containing protein n=1 Tax=Alsobacter ponti TaxID=2962936 RepID=A0ABT1LDU4_9HYPH|nr:cupin domain-containing protein [Alsobacter ponti]MCP8939672.1 cupin domain-containing protein [Alsobacter ponti]
MPVIRSHDAPPSWCELEDFEIIDLGGGSATRRRDAARERVMGTAGTTRLVHGGGSMVLKEGQFLDIELLPSPDYRLEACTPDAQVVRLSGHWGDDLAGCGIFRVKDEADPADKGDPVPYRKTTRIDSHYHDCDEYWILLEGRATVVVGDQHMEMGPGDCVTIGMGHHHDMAHAPLPVKAVFFETTLEGRKRIGHLWNHTHGPATPHPERV